MIQLYPTHNPIFISIVIVISNELSLQRKVIFFIILEVGYNYRGTGDGRCGVDTRTTHFSYHKVNFIIDSQDGGVISSQSHCIGSPMAPSFSNAY